MLSCLSSQWHWCVSTLNKRRPFFFPFFRRTENIVLWPTGEAKKSVFLTRTDSSSHNDSQDFPNRFFATLNILGSQDSISTIFLLSLLVCRHFSPLQVKYIYFICKYRKLTTAVFYWCCNNNNNNNKSFFLLFTIQYG